MPIPLGVLAVAGAGAGGAAGAYELLETQILGSNQASVTFSNLNSSYGSTYQHLQVRIVSRVAGSTRSANVFLEFNSDATGYSSHFMYGNPPDVTSDFTNATLAIVGRATGATSGANIFGASVVDILDPFETTKNKTVRSLAGATDGTSNMVFLNSAMWIDTAATTTLTFTSNSGNFVTNSRFSLYGMRSS